MAALGSVRPHSIPALPTLEISLAGHRLRVEVAVTPAAKARGLMGRSSLPEERGMLFPYEPPAPVSFWMKGVRFPLDLLFFDRDGCLIAHHDQVPPCTSAPCPSYPSIASTSWVLEVSAGTRERLSFEDGDCVLDLTP